MSNARLINAAIWLYLWLSRVMTPSIVPAADEDFWAAKAHQLVEFGPFDDIPRLLGRGLLPLILWAFIDWRLRRRERMRAA